MTDLLRMALLTSAMQPRALSALAVREWSVYSATLNSRSAWVNVSWRRSQRLLEENDVEVLLDYGLQHLVSFGAESMHIPLQDFEPGSSRRRPARGGGGVTVLPPHRHEVEQLIAGAAAGIPSALAVTYGASCDGSSRFLKEEHGHILLSCELRVAKVFRAAPSPC